MSGKYSKVFLLLFSLFLLCIFSAFPEDTPQILVLHSYHLGLEWADGAVEGIESVLKDSADLYFEFLDTKRFPPSDHPEQLHQISEILQVKYHDFPLDAVIACDDNALVFLLAHHDRLFPGVPVVFCGINEHSRADGIDRGLYTGILEINDIETTLKTAFDLLPDTETVFVITDNTTSGKTQYQIIKGISGKYEPEHSFVFLNADGRISMQRFKTYLQSASPDTIVYFGDFYIEADGNFIEYKKYLSSLTAEYDVPFFSHSSYYLNLGIVGGKVISSYYQGRAAAEMVVKIIEGTPPREIPIISDSPNKFMFDYRELMRYGIKETALPEGSIVVNKELSLFEQYRSLILLFIGLFIALIVFTIVLLFLISKRKRAEDLLTAEQALFSELLNNVPDFIFFKNTESRFIRINKALAEILGFQDPDEAVGSCDKDFFSSREWRRTREEELQVMESGRPHINFEEYLEFPSGRSLWMTTTKLPLKDAEGEITGIFGISRDVTERKKHEEAVTRSLAEKEVLLREIHHRVKNNLTMISSLISLQSQVSQETDRNKIFSELQNRIRSVALVHERLYRDGDLSAISFDRYVDELLRSARTIMNDVHYDIDCRIKIDGIRIGIDLAIPLGLIINELITNSFKYAFPGGNGGSAQQEKWVEVAMRRRRRNIELTVRDNGCGFPPDFDPGKSPTLGFQLIGALINQIHGTMDLDKERSACTISFPDRE